MAQHVNEEVGGDIAFYGLTRWWLTTFTPDERALIESDYQYLGLYSSWDNKNTYGWAMRSTLTKGKTTFSKRRNAAKVLFFLAGWFLHHREERYHYLGKRVWEKALKVTAANPITGPGDVDGRFYKTFVDEVKQLQKYRQYSEALVILRRLQPAADAYADATGRRRPDWYRQQIAIAENAIARAEIAQSRLPARAPRFPRLPRPRMPKQSTQSYRVS